jgi:murein L,D-transpeptidase YcbB/YkuD
VSRRIPVYVAYFTAWPNAKGEVGYHGDIYGRDERLRLAIEKTSAARAPSG